MDITISKPQRGKKMTLKRIFDIVYHDIDMETKLETIMGAVTGQKWWVSETQYVIDPEIAIKGRFQNIKSIIQLRTIEPGRGLTLKQLTTLERIVGIIEVLTPKTITLTITKEIEEKIEKEYWKVLSDANWNL